MNREQLEREYADIYEAIAILVDAKRRLDSDSVEALSLIDDAVHHLLARRPVWRDDGGILA